MRGLSCGSGVVDVSSSSPVFSCFGDRETVIVFASYFAVVIAEQVEKYSTA